MSQAIVRDALRRHFEESGLPLDGGYSDKWIPLDFGFITLPIYNSNSRKRAVRLHDIHHVITGYPSDPRGEAEISAWELAAGIYDKHFARFINLAGLFYGAFLFPKHTFKAFVLGRNSNTLYQYEYNEGLLSQQVEQLQQQLLPNTTPKATVRDVISYAAHVLFASLPAITAVIGLILLANILI